MQADGPVQSAYVSLLAELDSLGFTVDPAGMEGKIGSGDRHNTHRAVAAADRSNRWIFRSQQSELP